MIKERFWDSTLRWDERKNLELKFLAVYIFTFILYPFIKLLLLFICVYNIKSVKFETLFIHFILLYFIFVFGDILDYIYEGRCIVYIYTHTIYCYFNKFHICHFLVLLLLCFIMMLEVLLCFLVLLKERSMVGQGHAMHMCIMVIVFCLPKFELQNQFMVLEFTKIILGYMGFYSSSN